MSVSVRWLREGWILAALVFGSAGLAVPAAACINGVTHAPPRERKPLLVALRADQEPVQQLLLAEEALRQDNVMRAAHELDAIRQVMAQASPRLKSRFQRISSLVSIRADGHWPRWVAHSPSNSELERNETLAEALKVLRRRLREAPDDPVRRSDLGVALFSFPDRHGEARKLLEELAAKDLLTTARGYYALSRLRGAVGNGKGAEEALAECQKLDASGKACGQAPRGKV
jgi:predicted Zn-dependent protease